MIVLDIMIAEQSVSQTGQRLNMTQPAISNALSRLRQHFDDELFVVMGRRMAPTPLCDSLAEPVRKVLADLRLIAGTRATFDPAKAERTITIICSDYVFLVFLAEAIRKMSVVAPGVKVRTLLTNEGMTELLRSGRADFGIFPERRMVEGLPHTPLFEDGFSVVCWQKNSLVKDEMSTEQFLALNHVSASIGPNTPVHIEQESLDQHGLVRNIAVYAPNFTGVAEVVIGTDYIATVHSRAAKILATRMPLRVLAPPVAIAPFVVALQWNPTRDGDPGMTWIRNFLVECGGQL
ncbi:MAG TPA: LysR family transcriptional regulator [Hyphomonadaceae bacterium]|nr:LysR family transcriptional regulator [Hyphomonadaceae bacterium]